MVVLPVLSQLSSFGQPACMRLLLLLTAFNHAMLVDAWPRFEPAMLTPTGQRLAKALADLERTTTESNEKSHQILMLERDKDDLVTTNRAITSDIQRGEEAITAARLKQEHTETDCDFRLNIANQSKAAVETELGSVRTVYSTREGEDASGELASPAISFC